MKAEDVSHPMRFQDLQLQHKAHLRQYKCNTIMSNYYSKFNSDMDENGGPVGGLRAWRRCREADGRLRKWRPCREAEKVAALL